MTLPVIQSQGKLLRCGFTTGSAAAMATKAAALILLTGKEIKQSQIMTPKRILVTADVIEVKKGDQWASCVVVKDGGDDIDATDGAFIQAKVELLESGIEIDGGEGVGRVTKRGLNQPVGAAAINSTPRRMIREALEEISEQEGYKGGFFVEISVRDGKELAKKTFNENLGILGGISILGTTGIVEPRSVRALVDSIDVELKMLQENQVKEIIISPGNYSDSFLESNLRFKAIPNVKSSNYIGEVLDLSIKYDFERILLVGHIGKFVKLSAGIMNTHSREADGRTHIFAAYTALLGGTRETVREIMESKTTDACIEILTQVNLKEEVLDLVISDAQAKVEKRVKCEIGVVMFSNEYGYLGASKEAKEIMKRWRQ